jgi:hypothetical protein
VNHVVVSGRYDIWRGKWLVKQSNIPDLSVEADTRQEFTDAVKCWCDDHLGTEEGRVATTNLSKSLLVLKLRWTTREVINGRLVSRDKGSALRDMYKHAG